MFGRKRITLYLLLMSVVLFRPVYLAAELRLKNEDSEKEFEQLQREHQTLVANPRNPNRIVYRQLIGKFQYFAQSNSRSVYSSQAWYDSAQLLEELARITRLVGDHRQAVKAYVRYADRYSGHHKVDEALFRAARIFATRLSDESASVELLERIVERQKTGSAFFARAQRQLEAFQETQRGGRLAKSSGSTKNVHARSRNASDGELRHIRSVTSELKDGQQLVTIALDGPTEFSEGELSAFGSYPRRLFLDLKTVESVPSYEEEIGSCGLRKLRYASYRPTVARLVLELDNDAVCDISSDQPSSVITIKVSREAETEPVKGQQAGISLKNIPLNIDSMLKPGIKIVIDPGHGGNDPGAVGPRRTQEKNVTLDVAKRIARTLHKEIPTAKIYLTRTDDRTLSLSERTEFANRIEADLFISVHANAAPSGAVEGIETYYLDITNDRYSIRLANRENEVSEAQVTDLEYILADLAMKSNTQQSIALGDSVQKSILSSVRSKWSDVKDLGLKHALFYVLMGVKMPAILVETSFVSNPKEERRLVDKKYQDAIAQGVASGVQKYLHSIKPNRPHL